MTGGFLPVDGLGTEEIKENLAFEICPVRRYSLTGAAVAAAGYYVPKHW
jgi:hypothetical protein